MKSWSQLPSENNSITPIFPSLAFPNLEYFNSLTKFESISIEGFETFPKQTYRNRFYILSANGELVISVPIVKEKDFRALTNQVRISYHDKWNLKAWRAIESAYGKSPYFEYFEQEIRTFFFNEYEKLIDFNTEVLSYFLKRWKIETTINSNSQYIKLVDENLDFRVRFEISKMKEFNSKPYYQCFCDKYGYVKNLSCLDLLFNQGVNIDILSK